MQKESVVSNLELEKRTHIQTKKILKNILIRELCDIIEEKKIVTKSKTQNLRSIVPRVKKALFCSETKL